MPETRNRALTILNADEAHDLEPADLNDYPWTMTNLVDRGAWNVMGKVCRLGWWHHQMSKFEPGLKLIAKVCMPWALDVKCWRDPPGWFVEFKDGGRWEADRLTVYAAFHDWPDPMPPYGWNDIASDGKTPPERMRRSLMAEGSRELLTWTCEFDWVERPDRAPVTAKVVLPWTPRCPLEAERYEAGALWFLEFGDGRKVATSALKLRTPPPGSAA